MRQLARDDGTDVVGADADVGGVGESGGSVGDGVDGVGAVDAGVGEDSVGVRHSSTSVDEGGVGIGLPLPAARHNGSVNVGADANVGGVGGAEGSVGDGVGSSGVGDGVGSDSVGVADKTGGVNQGGVGLSLPLAVVGVGVARVGVGVGRVSGHDVGGSDGSNGSVGDHADVVGPSILDCLGNVGSCGNLANGPRLRLSLEIEFDNFTQFN